MDYLSLACLGVILGIALVEAYDLSDNMSRVLVLGGASNDSPPPPPEVHGRSDPVAL